MLTSGEGAEPSDWLDFACCIVSELSKFACTHLSPCAGPPRKELGICLHRSVVQQLRAAQYDLAEDQLPRQRYAVGRAGVARSSAATLHLWRCIRIYHPPHASYPLFSQVCLACAVSGVFS